MVRTLKKKEHIRPGLYIYWMKQNIRRAKMLNHQFQTNVNADKQYDLPKHVVDELFFASATKDNSAREQLNA